MATLNDQLTAKGQGDTLESLKAQLDAMTKRNAELTAAAATRSTLTFKVSEKGALSVYGIQRFPVSLYVDQWERIIKALPAMQEFITANAAGLQRKPVKA